MRSGWSAGIKEPRICFVRSGKPLEDSESVMGIGKEPQSMALPGKATPGSQGLCSMWEALRELELDPLYQCSSQSTNPRTPRLSLWVGEVKTSCAMALRPHLLFSQVDLCTDGADAKLAKLAVRAPSTLCSRSLCLSCSHIQRNATSPETVLDEAAERRFTLNLNL